MMNENPVHDLRMNTLYMDQVEALESVEDLTPWESEFIESIKDRMEGGRGLTSNQADCLSKIWDRKGR